MDAVSPQRLGDFEIVREIGRGGMGVVYEARQLSLNRKVALKVLSGGLGLTPKAVQRFHREAEAAAKLHHTNIVPVYATGEEDDTHFYAMEMIDGPSLDHVIRQMRQTSKGQPSPEATNEQKADAHGSPALEATGPYVTESGSGSTLSASSLNSDSHYFDTVARMMAEVADALDYAHKNGVIHRDVKPSNLLLSSAGRLSLNDFGLARVLEQPGMTLSGEFVGTPAYMSPEQIAVGRIPLDHRTDIYSLGATLYELLTLQPPHQGRSREQVLAQIVQKEPTAPRRIQKKVPVDLETICLKCLEKDPDRRYQSAGALAEDLRRYVNRFAISARRAGPVQRLVKWIRRRPAVAAGLACTLLAVCVAGWFGYQAHMAEEQRRVERDQHDEQLRAERRQNAIERALVAAMSGDFDGAQEATRQAELLGAHPGWIRMLNGHVALRRGKVTAALQELEQAVRLMPDSVAAKALRATAYYYAGQNARVTDLLNELERLDPVSPEDLLFKAEAEAALNTHRALRTLDAAVGRRDPILARLIRAYVRALHAGQTGDPNDAELAVEDAAVVRSLLGHDSAALIMSVWTHVIAARAYERIGEEPKRQDHLASAARDVTALEPFRDLPPAITARGAYYAYVGQEEAALEEWRRGAEMEDPNPENIGAYVIGLWMRGQFAKALEVSERTAAKIKGTYGEVSLGYVLAELDRPRAQRLCQELVQRTRDGNSTLPDSTWCYYPTIARLLGDNKQADTLNQELRWSPRGAWLQALHGYSCGLLSDDRLFAAAGDSRSNQLVAHFQVALRHLAQGERQAARKHFRAARDCTDLLYYFEYKWSRAFLARMEQDPTWPPWIPVKKDEPKP